MFTPVRARWGERIKIEGEGLADPAIKVVRFGSIDLPIVKRQPDGKAVWVVVPDSARGTAYLEITDAGKVSRSPAPLEIQEPPPSTTKVRDHRTK